MKKNIWIMNHYATAMYAQNGGRHYSLAKNMLLLGYSPIIICASTFHNSNEEIDIPKGKYKVLYNSMIPFIFIKSSHYKGNGFLRIKNIGLFTYNVVSSCQNIVKEFTKPDLIIASSVHPLTLIAGLIISHRLDVPCICEVRDLWPESLVAYGYLKRNSLIAKILYLVEKNIYQKADAIIMTWEGGFDYIKDRGWDSVISEDKIHYISNGIDVSEFNDNKQNIKIPDNDLEGSEYIKIVYTGSIRRVNNLGLIVESAKILQEHQEIKFLIYGDGDERIGLEKRCKDYNLKNIVFKGKVKKTEIPYILSMADINLLHNSSTNLNRYGQSQNKLFEYLASGKPILQTYSTNYNIIERYNLGIAISEQNPAEIAKGILDIIGRKCEWNDIQKRSIEISKQFDFNTLTNKLTKIIESTRGKNHETI